MAIYDYKEFLTIDDVAEYLTDKGVGKFYPLSNYNVECLKNLLIEWVRNSIITPVFYSSSVTDVISYKYDGGQAKTKYVDGGLILDAYYSIDANAYQFICQAEKLTANYKSDNNNDCDDDSMLWKYYITKGNMGHFIYSVFQCELYKPLRDHQPKILQDCHVHYEPFADDETIITFNDLLYPTIQLDLIFNLHPTDLQQENDRLQARIVELEQQLATPSENAMPANLTGLNKVNYDKQKAKQFAKIVAKSIWEMDSTKQIKTGDMVKFLLPLINEFDSQNLPETDDSIREWIKDIRPNYAVTSGRPPNNAPKEIPLTFKK